MYIYIYNNNNIINNNIPKSSWLNVVEQMDREDRIITTKIENSHRNRNLIGKNLLKILSIIIIKKKRVHKFLHRNRKLPAGSLCCFFSLFQTEERRKGCFLNLIITAGEK